MANLNLIKLRVRRGANEDRKQVLLEAGEIGYVSDFECRRVVVGDGVILGGRSIAAKFYSGSIEGLWTGQSAFAKALSGDIIYNRSDSSLYVLTGADFLNISKGYYNISPKTNGQTITGTNAGKISVQQLGISGLQIHDSVFDTTFGFNMGLYNKLQVNNDNVSIQYNSNRELYIDPRNVPWQDLPRSYPGPNLMWIDETEDGTVRVGPKPITNFIEFNISWNTNSRIITAFLPGEPVGDNAFDRPRINTFRTDGTFIEYASAGFQIWDPVSKTFSTPWGNRTIGVFSQTVPLLNSTLSGGVDVFVPITWPTPTFNPPISQWVSSINPAIPEEIKYQYLINIDAPSIQNISVNFN